MKNVRLCVCVLLSAVFLFLLLPSGGRAAQDLPPEGWTGIYDREDLSRINLDPAGQYILMNDVDLTGTPWAALCSEDLPFTGVLDGNGFTVYGMEVISDAAPVGLFSSIWGGQISDLTVAGTSTGPVAGLLAGKLCEGSLTGCKASGTVNALFCGGGLVGQISGDRVTVSDCSAACTVSGPASCDGEVFLGGLTGSVHGTEITLRSCETAGTLSFSGALASVGGIAGVLDGDVRISDCGTEAALSLSVSDRGTVGGMVGRMGRLGGEISRCSFRADWTAAGTGSLSMGGIVGEIFALAPVSVMGCIAYGSLTSGTASSALGGIVGSSVAGGGDVAVLRCTSFARLSATGCPLFMGGICGENRGDSGTALIENCHADGTILHDAPVNADTSLWFGGICGINGGEDASVIRRCFSSCEVSVTYPMGDGAAVGMSYPFGETGTVSVEQCYFRAGVKEHFATPVPGASLSLPAAFVGFDFSEVWEMEPSFGMPRLRDWEPSAVLPAGDVDGNGRVTGYDARLLAQYLTGRSQLTEAQLLRGDVDGDGNVDARDVSLILRNAS